ncbi:hypothetical protein RB213_007263 [Colletotrichum asianum]
MDLDISDPLLAILALCVPLALYTATIEMREDMLNPEPRFPKNMLRRLLCWILMSISLVFFWVTILVLMALQATLIIIGLSLMEIGRVLSLAVACGLKRYETVFQKGLMLGGTESHVDTEKGFDEVDSTSDEDLETLAKSVA